MSGIIASGGTHSSYPGARYDVRVSYIKPTLLEILLVFNTILVLQRTIYFRFILDLRVLPFSWVSTGAEFALSCLAGAWWTLHVHRWPRSDSEYQRTIRQRNGRSKSTAGFCSTSRSSRAGSPWTFQSPTCFAAKASEARKDF